MPGPTQLLSSLERGENHAAKELLPLVYDELRRLAAWHLANERPAQTLDATAFVHEAWLRLWSDLLNLIPPCRNCEALFFAGPTQPEKQKWFHEQSDYELARAQPMKTRRKIALGVAVIAVLALTGLALYARTEAHKFVTNPVGTRKVPLKTPADVNLPFEDVVITNKDGLKLVAWYIPSENGAAIIVQHGRKMCRDEMLPAAAVLHKYGYGVLICSVRAHDRCDGEQLTFGIREVEDMKSWLDYLTTRPDVDTNRIAALGNSMGGSLVIQIAARDSRIKAVAADSAFSSADDTLATSVTHVTGLPAFPFAPLMRFWAEVETGCDFSKVNAKIWIKQISPRPVFLMQGGADTTVSRRSGELLYAAAGEPKELWYDPAAGHASFATNNAYEQRLVAFFDQALKLAQPKVKIEN